jgi:hypothetical protein
VGVAPEGWHTGGDSILEAREEGGRPMWRKEMAAARTRSAARTTTGGGDEVSDGGDWMGEADG